MKSAQRTIVKNASALMSSQIITWGLSLLLVIFLPRYLGPVGIGELQIATSIWAIMGVLIAFGTDTLLTKEIARHPEKAAHLLGTTFILRGVLFTVSYGLVALYLSFQQYSLTVVYLVAIVGVSHLVAQWIGASGAVMRGMEIMGAMSIAGIVGQVMSTGLGIAFLLLGYGVYGVAVTGIIAGIVTLLIQMAFLKRQTSTVLRFRFGEAVTILRASAPYLLSGLTLILYSQVDTFVISWFVNTTTIGWYSVAMRLFGSLFFIPVVLTTSVFPAMTRQYTKNPSEMPRLLRKSFDLMLLVSVPLGLGMLIVSGPLVVLLFGPQFAPSGPVLALLGIVVIFTYQNMLFGQFLISTDRQNAWTIVMIVATVATILADIPIIPWCERTFNNGAIGGAITFIFAEFGMTIAGLYLIPKGTLGKANAWTAARTVTAGIIMVAGIWWFRDMFIAIPVILGAIIYIGLIVILRVIPAEDILVLRETVQQVIVRVRGRKQISIEGV